MKEEYIKKYGIDAWKKYSERYKSTLEKNILRYGAEEGTKRYNAKIEKDKVKGTLAGYISRYGEAGGPKKYYEKNSRLSVGRESLLNRGFSEEEVTQIKTRHAKGSAITLDNLIIRYGEQEGTERYEIWLAESKLRSHRTAEFWISRGLTETEAKEKVSSIQNTSSLIKFIARYGKEIGTKRYLQLNIKKTEKWTETTRSVSKLETQFFERLAKITKIDLEKGTTCKIAIGSKLYFCDYADVTKNKIIEIYGYFWHMKPSIYVESDVNPVKKRTAKEIWESDGIRVENLKAAGFDVLILWEDEINKNLVEQLTIAKHFLEE